MSNDRIKHFYSHGMESDRLETDLFWWEGIRTKEIIARYLRFENMAIADIGGGAGYYAFWLQQLKHHVSLVDLSPRNIELAKNRSASIGIDLTECKTGDATNLDFSSEQFDLVLLLGPMYHLQEMNDRAKALSEAKRILKPGGYVLIATISRYASLLDGFGRDLINDDHFYSLMIEDLKSGRHNNNTESLDYFTTAYFHTPDEIKREVSASGLRFERTLAIESFAWMIKDVRKKALDNAYQKKLETVVNMLEENTDLLPLSAHMLTVAVRA